MDISDEVFKTVDEIKTKYRLFPYNCCEVTATALEKYGFEHKSGVFIDESGKASNHDWSVKDGIIYDFTAKQFSDVYPNILIKPEESDYVKKHYEEGIGFLY